MSLLKSLFRHHPAVANSVTVHERARFARTMPGEVAARAGSRFGWVG